MQQDTLLLCPNAVVNITNEMARKRKIFNFGMVKRLVLPLNVGKENGQTFIGTMNKSGNHWVLVVVEIRPFKRILYCDTLAWKPLSDTIDVVNSYTSHISRIGKYDDTHLFLAHHPMATSRFGHMRRVEMPQLSTTDMLWRMWSHCSNNRSAGGFRPTPISVLDWSQREKSSLSTTPKPTCPFSKENHNVLVCRKSHWNQLCASASWLAR